MRLGSKLLLFYLIPPMTSSLSLTTLSPSKTLLFQRRNPSTILNSISGGSSSDPPAPNDQSNNNNNPSSSSLSDRLRLTPSRISVAAILTSTFLNLLGFTMAGPITPALGQHFDLKIGASFGSLTSAYPLGMIIGLNLWPQLSDRIGRKPVIAASLLGSGLGLGAQSLAIKKKMSLSVFLAVRVLTGSFAGSSPVSKAYLADVGAEKDKLPRYLALRDAASTMAFVVGPALGGILYEARRIELGTTATKPLSFVIAITSVASLASALLVALCVKEVPPKPSSSSSSTTDDIKTPEIINCPLGNKLWAGVATVCVVSFLFNVADSTFHAFFPALLKTRLTLDAKAIGLAYTILACVSLCISTTVTSNSVKRNGPVSTCVAGLSFVGMGLSLLSLVPSSSPSFFVFMAAALYYCGVPLYGPTIPTMLLQCVPKYKRGAVMGLDGTINTVARVISPLVMGELYRRFGSGVAFGCAAFMSFAAAIVAVFRRFVVLKEIKFAPT